jgi:hypothetical protein
VSARRLRSVLAALGFAGVAAAAAAADAEPRVRLELAPDPLGLEETAQLVLEVTTSGLGGVSFAPEFRLENLEIAGGPSTRHGTRWENGRTSSSASSVWWLRPKAVGRAAVRSVRLRVGEAVIPLPDREIEVVAEPPPGRPPRPGGAGRGPFDPSDPFDALFGDDPLSPFRRRQPPPAARPTIRLRAELDRSSAWVGEQVAWRLVLDTQADISAFNPRSLPDFEGFWVREIPLPERLRPEWVEAGGQRLGRVTVLRRALFPLRPGRLRLAPVEAQVLARVAEAGWFGPLARDQELALETAPLELVVRALPPRPAGAPSVVGEIEIGSRLDRTTIRAGEAATWTVTAAGFGNLSGLAAPEPSVPSGLRLFPPRPESSESAGTGRIRTQLTWRFVVVADRPGVYELPAIQLGWFDPATGQDRTTASAPLRLEVAPAPADPSVATEARPDAESAAAEGAAPDPARRLGVLAGAAAVLAALAVLVARTVRRRRRLRRAGHAAILAAIEAARVEPSPRQAAVRLEEAWRAVAAERWGVSPGLPVAHWPERLVAAGLDPGPARQLVALLDELHNLRYAPELASVESLREEVLEASRRLVSRLR